jgi:hypothetical protein
MRFYLVSLLSFRDCNGLDVEAWTYIPFFEGQLNLSGDPAVGIAAIERKRERNVVIYPMDEFMVIPGKVTL